MEHERIEKDNLTEKKETIECILSNSDITPEIKNLLNDALKIIPLDHLKKIRGRFDEVVWIDKKNSEKSGFADKHEKWRIYLREERLELEKIKVILHEFAHVWWDHNCHGKIHHREECRQEKEAEIKVQEWLDSYTPEIRPISMEPE